MDFKSYIINSKNKNINTLKKIIVLAALLFAFNLASNAQGNLQFNRVITGAAILAPNTSIGLITVPAGKVWKLEAINFEPPPYLTMYLQINGVNVYTNFSYPFWLAAGNTFNLTTAGSVSSGNTQVQYSIIEFNIVP